MKQARKIIEPIVEGMFRVSGAITGITILLIIVFLFKEGFGLFQSPTVEKGYSLYVHSTNKVEALSVAQIKDIYDQDVTRWEEVGGTSGDIMTFRIEDIFKMYKEEEMGENYELLPQKLAEVIATHPNIVAYLPDQYAPAVQGDIKKIPSRTIGWKDFFLGMQWMPTATPAPQFGVLPLIGGTLLVSIVAILIALPLGLGVAIYLSELASRRMRGILKPVIELLAGIPSVVYGFFGLIVLVPLVQDLFGLPVGETAFTGSLILAIMALPTIITVAEDAMRNTPRAMRESSLALGATQWQTIYKVVLPYSISGISAAVVLGIGRAIGETMAVLMVTGNAAILTHNVFEPVRTIPATIAAELGEVPAGSAHYRSLFLLGCILFAITMVISISAEMIGKRRAQE
ncbi:MAG: phosphate ABC transporter permease subunit PstC [Phocaeicola sp.]|nr:phosphate ABC transporter permease subunit PstC [Phocaeicola sp.]MDY3913529.1 phosphate ABC transporter permease subunit PstC [Phocaeicola sp.]